MNNSPAFITRLLLPIGLVAAVVGAALVTASSAGADPPAPGAGPLTLPAPAEPVPTAVTPLTLDRFGIIDVGGTAATLDVAASAPAILSYTIRRVDGRAHNDESGTAGLPTVGYQREYRVRLLNLDSNTSYDVTVAAVNGDGQTIATTRFTTPKQRVRVTLREINVTDDGDSFLTGDGDLTWYLRLEWAGGFSGGCFPIDCQVGSYGEGRIFPRNPHGQPLKWLFAEENFDTAPTSFTINAGGYESDATFFPRIALAIEHFIGCVSGACGLGPDELQFTSDSWRVPAGQDVASTTVSLTTDNSGQGLKSTMTFTFELFHDNLSYPSARNTPQSTWHR